MLRDGFTQFQTKFKVGINGIFCFVFGVLIVLQDDPTLVENWDKDVWASDWT